MIRQAHRIPTRTRRFEKYVDKLVIAFAILGLIYFVLRLF
jgi:hypothetical protein